MLLPVAIMGLTCLLLWGIAGALVLVVRRDVQAGVRVTGEVYAFGTYVRKGQTMYVAKYRAMLPDGREVRGSSSMGKSWQSPAVGTGVVLVYRADDHDNPLHETGGLRYLVPGILFAVGAVVGGIGMALAIA
jgi:hypothetical protein